MARSHQVTINGQSFQARPGEVLLDAALNNGVDLPYSCRAGHCGACCVRLVSGEVRGGEGSEPGIVHACQCRIAGDVVIEQNQAASVRSVEGVLSSVRALSPEVMEVGIRTSRALPYLAGQFAQLQFSGYPSRPFSITHPLNSNLNSRAVWFHVRHSRSIWFHVRRMKEGQVTRLLGRRIKTGHRVTVTGPYGSAHFRPNLDGRVILVATNTGFAPIWSIAVAALRENPEREMMIIAGGRTLESLYMGPALAQLARFPNVVVVPCCSSPQTVSQALKPGRPTDYLPRLLPTDVLYACGAPQMVDSIKSIADDSGAVCHADPFVPTPDDNTVVESVLTRAMRRLAGFASRPKRDDRPMDEYAGDRPRKPRSRNRAERTEYLPRPARAGQEGGGRRRKAGRAEDDFHAESGRGASRYPGAPAARSAMADLEQALDYRARVSQSSGRRPDPPPPAGNPVRGEGRSNAIALPRNRREQPRQGYRTAETRVRDLYRS
jgi:NAD(P)H-flavin reductase/ferredoxin